MWGVFINIEEVDVLSSPFKVMHKLAWTVTLLKNERILEQFTEFVYYIYIRIVCNSARKFSKFSLLYNLIFTNGFKSKPNAFEAKEVEIYRVIFQEINIRLKFLKFLKNACYLAYYILLLLFTIFKVS